MVSGINSMVLINVTVKSARNLQETPEMIEKEIKKRCSPGSKASEIIVAIKIFSSLSISSINSPRSILQVCFENRFHVSSAFKK